MFYSNLNNIRMCVSIMTIISLSMIMTTMMMAVEYVNRVPASRIISNLDGRRWKRGSGPCTTRQIWCQRYICGESMCLITVHGAQWTRYRPLGHMVQGTRHTVIAHRTRDTYDTQYKNRANIIKTKKNGEHNTHLMKYSKHDTPYKKYGAQSMCLITRVARARSMELPSQLILGSIFIFLFWF